jgi:HlyD family secretion protein
LIEPGDEQNRDGACCVPLLAPANGRVLAIDQISARPVVAGARLVTIGDPTELEIVADILSVDAVRLEIGAQAFVDRWGGSGAIGGKARAHRTGGTNRSLSSWHRRAARRHGV